MAFEKKEKSPSVIMFRGRETMLNIGFRILYIREKTSPPSTIVPSPSEILNPATICGRTNRESELMAVSRIKDFIKANRNKKERSNQQKQNHKYKNTKAPRGRKRQKSSRTVTRSDLYQAHVKDGPLPN